MRRELGSSTSTEAAIAVYPVVAGAVQSAHGFGGSVPAVVTTLPSALVTSTARASPR